ncbi:hypothetical protein CDAR_34961 [Caerostris darwini]|uniref:Uncharacterized protein n=1 Tax=Caerostris darwini TaxID=1538125 RepID=A0AAV4MW67_9ARAC|nr:hypothetical protein CDAR_34961 [Caerostris darwini]
MLEDILFLIRKVAISKEPFTFYSPGGQRAGRGWSDQSQECTIRVPPPPANARLSGHRSSPKTPPMMERRGVIRKIDNAHWALYHHDKMRHGDEISPPIPWMSQGLLLGGAKPGVDRSLLFLLIENLAPRCSGFFIWHSCPIRFELGNVVNRILHIRFKILEVSG